MVRSPKHKVIHVAKCESMADLPAWIVQDEELLSVACDYANLSMFPIAVLNDGRSCVMVPCSHLRDFTSLRDLSLAILEWAKGPRAENDSLI